MEEVLFLGEIVGPIVKAILQVIRAVWRAYVRVLNLPILVAVALDAVGGVAGGISLIRSADDGGALLGFWLVVGTPAFFLASLFSWGCRVVDEEEEVERRQASVRP